MRILVKVAPRASKNEVIKIDAENFKIRTTAPALDGRANEAVIKLIAKYFGVAKSRIKIVQGVIGRNKIIQIDL